jgi:cytochrome b6-f complex iron-sulfur subunit
MSNNAKETKSQTKPTRRSFLNILWIGLGFVALAEFIAVVFAFLRPPKSKAAGETADSMMDVGAVEKFAPNSVTAFVRGKFYLARLQDGGFLALSRKCTHLGCTVPWVGKEMKFACPCHGSQFDITGNVIDAPAPRALDIYPVSIENKIIKVDTRRPIKRSTFRVEQVAYLKDKS